MTIETSALKTLTFVSPQISLFDHVMKVIYNAGLQVYIDACINEQL